MLTRCLVAQMSGPQGMVPEQQHLITWQHGNAGSWALPSPVESKTLESVFTDLQVIVMHDHVQEPLA